MHLFDEATLRQLEQLTLVASQVRVGLLKGDRRSKKRGSSVEFADYREYTPGDDLRRLDWNLFARLERPFIKLLEEEEDMSVHILVDGSASMVWPTGDGPEQKFRYGLRLAGALGHISLASNDLTQLTLLQSNGNRQWGPFRGQHNSLRLLQFLASASGAGITDLNLSLQQYALRGRKPGLIFIITDLFSPSGYQEGIAALQGRGYEVGLFHLLSPDEADPPLAGDVKLVDIETGLDAEITLDASTQAQYLSRLRDWQRDIEIFCRGRNVHYIPLTTDTPWEKIVLQTLRAQGLAK